MKQPSKAWLALRNDDAIQVWLNGKLVHENWTTRTVAEEEDFVPVEFQSGTNRLLLKIQNVQGGWGFGCRLATAESLADKFVWLALAGDVNSFKNDPYDFDPGKQFRYDNSGYFLLGYIVEQVSGETYNDFLERSFFEPLGMTNTGVHRADLKLEHEARGYQYEEGKFRDAPNWDMSRAGGAGALYSCVEDLFQWNEGIFDGKVLSEASLKAAFTPVKSDSNQEDASDTGYGYGWALTRLRGAQIISHNGGLDGFESFLLRLPREHFTVAVLANARPGVPELEPDRLAQIVAEAYLGECLAPKSPPRLAKGLSIQALDAVAGRYDLGGADLVVQRKGNRLYALVPGLQAEIFPASETNFFWRLVDVQVTFVKGQNGKVVKAILHPNGRTIQGPRIQ
jgi:Beta-lactamase